VNRHLDDLFATQSARSAVSAELEVWQQVSAKIFRTITPETTSQVGSRGMTWDISPVAGRRHG
jgi:hypothetical protein